MAADSRSQTSVGSGQSDHIARPAQADAGDVEKLAPSRPPGPPTDEELFQPRSVRFWLTLLCNFLALFLVALDRTIIATAVPRISDEFKALGDIGWYGSSYMLTTACAQLLFGRIYKFYDMKWAFLMSIIVFETGSAICGAAPNSTAFIVGRAIAGLGSAGIFSGCLLIMIPMIPLHRRPAFQGLFGMVFGIASVLGPLIGGGFTGGVTWRWCFYLNLPIGALALVFMIFYWNPPRQKHEPVKPIVHFKRLDPLGMLFFLPGTVCLFTAFQWGGSTYAWSEWRIIVLLIVFAVCTVAFIAVQILKPETASVPPRVITQRSVAFGTGFTFFLAGSMLMLVYYVPVWFQTVRQVDPMRSGIYTLPLVLSLVVSSIGSGAITQKIGYYVPSMIVAPILMSIGEGLLTTLDQDSPTSHWVAYQFLAGFGLGFGMQTSGLAVQTVLPREDISTGIAINFFVQQLGGAVFTSVGQTILTNMLVSQLADIPGFDPKMIVQEGATKLTHSVPPEDVHVVIDAYNTAIQHIFFASMGLAFAALLCALGMEWRSIKKGKGPPGAPPPGGKPGPGSKPNGASRAGPSQAGASSKPKSPTATAGPAPGKPFFEGVKNYKTKTHRPSLLNSIMNRPKSNGDHVEDAAGIGSGSGGRRHSVLTKAVPPNHHRRRSSAMASGSAAAAAAAQQQQQQQYQQLQQPPPVARMQPPSSSDTKKDELAGVLRDWARFDAKAEEKMGEEGGGKQEGVEKGVRKEKSSSWLHDA